MKKSGSLLLSQFDPPPVSGGEGRGVDTPSGIGPRKAREPAQTRPETEHGVSLPGSTQGKYTCQAKQDGSRSRARAGRIPHCTGQASSLLIGQSKVDGSRHPGLLRPASGAGRPASRPTGGGRQQDPRERRNPLPGPRTGKNLPEDSSSIHNVYYTPFSRARKSGKDFLLGPHRTPARTNPALSPRSISRFTNARSKNPSLPVIHLFSHKRKYSPREIE